MGRLDRSDTTASYQTGMEQRCTSWCELGDRGPLPQPLSHPPKAGDALVSPLVLRISMGSGNCLPSGDTSARLLSIPQKKRN